MSGRATWALLAATCLAAAGVTLAFLLKRPDAADVPALSSEASLAIGVPARIEACCAGDAEPSSIGPSDDTEAPDGLFVGSDGHLRIARETRDTFEYFLASEARVDRKRQMARLLAYIDQRLGAPAARLARVEARDLAEKFATYMDAHDALVGKLERERKIDRAQISDTGGIAAFLRERSLLRQQHLGFATASLWYGEDEASEQQTLQTMQAPSPTTATADLNAAQPPAQVAAKEIANLRLNGHSPAEIREYIRREIGEDAAQRFDVQTQLNDAWSRRYDSYRVEADAVANHPGLDAAEKDRQLAAIRARIFPDTADRLRAEFQ